MRPQYAVLALASLAKFGLSVPLEATQTDAVINLPSDLVKEIGIDPSIIGQTLLEIVEDEDEDYDDDATLQEKRSAVLSHDIDRRNPPQFKGQPMSAADVLKIPKKDVKLKKNVLLRGDSRPYADIFRDGFEPRGGNMNIDDHLSKKKDSGFVSTTRSVNGAVNYMFGDSANRGSVGQIFAIVPNNVPDGYWIPGSLSDGAVNRNQEFAVRGKIPPESIAGVNIISNDPKVKPQWIPNPNSPYAESAKKDGRLKSGSYFSCFGRKRAMTCSIKNSKNVQTTKPKPKPKPDGGRKPGQKNPTKGIKVPGTRFLQWVHDVSPEAFKPLAEALSNGDITPRDCQLGFKRAVSKVISVRWTDFGSAEKALESIKNIALDVSQTARTTVPVALWEDILKALPDIAREISKGKTPEEKLRIANKDIHFVVRTWTLTPLGKINERLMESSANEEPVVQTAAAAVNSLWSWTPLGWIVNQVVPLDSLIKQIGV